MSIGNRSITRNKPLSDKLTDHQMERRTQRITARRHVAAQLIGQNSLIRNALIGFTQMNFLSRIKWMILGPRFMNTTGTVILIGMLVLIIGLITGLHLYLVH